MSHFERFPGKFHLSLHRARRLITGCALIPGVASVAFTKQTQPLYKTLPVLGLLRAVSQYPVNITDVGMWLVKSYLTEASFYAVLSLIPICSHLCAREYSLPVATSTALCARPTRLSSML